MKSILRLTGILTLFCALAAALLAWVRDATAEAIVRAEENKRIQAVRAVLPSDAGEPVTLSIKDPLDGRPVEVFAVFDADGQWRAAAFEVVTAGYGGEIALMVGMTAEGTLKGISVLRHQETPGLGANIESDAFQEALAGRDLADTRWKVTKDGGDIQGITAATISSRAVLDAIREAIERLDRLRDRLVPPGKRAASETES